MERFRKPISEWLSQATKTEIKINEVESPQDRTLADFAYPCFRLSKTLRKAPPLIAQEIAQALQSLVPQHEFKVAAVGPYVNFTLSLEQAAKTFLKDLLSTQTPYGSLPAKSREKWVFEFSSPNVAKPFQIYHLRTTIVGSSLSKIAKLRGHDVTTINHIGDWGTQYGKLAIALERYKNELPAELTLQDLVKVYIKIHQDIAADPSIEAAGRAAFLKLEQGDPGLRAIWKKCVDISLTEFKKTYARYQVEFDHYWGESHYEELLKPLIQKLKAAGTVVQDQGALIVPVKTREGKDIPPCILEKSDGASIYATRDLAAVLYRHEKFNFDHMTYVVGMEQKLHFEQVFGVLRAMGMAWEPSCEHLATGLYRFKDSKMSTRKGNFVTLDEVNTLCLEKTHALMNARILKAESKIENQKSGETLTTEEQKEIADQVTIGAIVFADLSTDPAKDMEFDVDRVISFDGETGPYLQYAHTRCLSILRKSEVPREQIQAASASVAQFCTTNAEVFLLKTLGKFPLILERTLEFRKPSFLANYLIDLTHDFGTFYQECKVMNPENEGLSGPSGLSGLSLARLVLVEATRTILSSGLDLLGIPKPKRM